MSTTVQTPTIERVKLTHSTTVAWPLDKPPADDAASMELHGVDQSKHRMVKRNTIVNPLKKDQVIDTCHWEEL